MRDILRLLFQQINLACKHAGLIGQLSGRGESCYAFGHLLDGKSHTYLHNKNEMGSESRHKLRIT